VRPSELQPSPECLDKSTPAVTKFSLFAGFFCFRDCRFRRPAPIRPQLRPLLTRAYRVRARARVRARRAPGYRRPASPDPPIPTTHAVLPACACACARQASSITNIIACVACAYLVRARDDFELANRPRSARPTSRKPHEQAIWRFRPRSDRRPPPTPARARMGSLILGLPPSPTHIRPVRRRLPPVTLIPPAVTLSR
jgi:hypothetical protein